MLFDNLLNSSTNDHPIKLKLEAAYDAAIKLRQSNPNAKDPKDFLMLYDCPEDIELIGLIASCLAFGRVDRFYEVIAEVLARLGPSPYEFILKTTHQDTCKLLNGIAYRYIKSIDLAVLISGVRNLNLNVNKTLGQYAELGSSWNSDFKNSLEEFRWNIVGMSESPSNLGFMLPKPSNGSACKRLLMYMRWMVRNDELIDHGHWNFIKPSSLVIPLDTHSTSAVNKLDLFNEEIQPCWDDAVKVTNELKRFDPVDPTRYDFGLYLMNKLSPGVFL